MQNAAFAITAAMIAFVALYPAIFTTVFAELFAQFPLPDDTVSTEPTGSPALVNGIPDLFYHFGGNGPWIPKVNATVEGGIEPPEGCHVTQVHMLSRHAERYPTVAAANKMWTLYNRMLDANTSFNGSLTFIRDWDFFIDDPSAIENLVSIGPYAGTLEAFETGVRLRTRYRHLLDEANDRGTTTYWASDSPRVIDTAKYFGTSFFGIDSHKARLEVIPEAPDRGADTLTPGRSCLEYRNDANEHGRLLGYNMMEAFRHSYEPDVVQRLAAENPDFVFTEDEIFSMQLMCGFEILAKGASKWCDVFTAEEWESFEYARDVIHYYRSGPGNPYGATMGWLWLNATTNLLREGPEEAGPLFMSFVHDGDLIPALTALNLFPQMPDLPVTHILHNRTFRTSDVVPMGGRLILERLACPIEQECWTNAPFYPNHVYCTPPDEEEVFVRVNVNDGIVALPGCDGGPGRSCPLEHFLERVRETGEKVGVFGEVCGLGEEAPGRITFLHQ